MARQNKNSWPRLMHIISMLKENRYPNHPKIKEDLGKIDPAGTYSITQKTIQRDIDFLRHEYHAPIGYDASRKGYYLTDPNWYLELPTLMTKDLESIAFSAKLAEKILPSSVLANVRTSVDSLFAASDAEVTDDRTDLLSLVATGSQVPIDPAIFNQVFHAWKIRHLIRLSYASAKDNGREQIMLVEPQTLAYHNNIWYLIAKVRQKDGEDCPEITSKTLAVHRIRNLEQLPQTFESNPDIIRAANEDKIFNFPQVKDVVLKLTGASIMYTRERFPAAEFTEHADGSATIHLPSIERYAIINYVLTWAGHVVALAPQSLVQEIAQTAQAILKSHQDPLDKP